MSNLIQLLILLFIINPVFLSTISCKAGENNCLRCDPLTKLCTKCSLDIYSPDEDGGCSPSGKCILGKNYCAECDEDEEKCSKCEPGLFPDENGGCSFVGNCEISYRGQCLKCLENYILIGGEQDAFKICKSLDSEDLANCQSINKATGLCEACKTGYFLNGGDYRCTKTENCFESAFDKCILCNGGFYLDKKEEKCITHSGKFLFCQLSLDGKTCDTCDEDYFFDEKGNCVGVNYCSEGSYYSCEKCLDGYYPTFDKIACTKEKNCYSADRTNGVCKSCKGDNYIDLDTGKCHSNREDDDFKYCKQVEDEKCLYCEYGYNLSEDGKCTTSRNCAVVEEGECQECSEGYYLTLDNRCTTTKHCIYSETYYDCNECEDGYYLNRTDKICYETKKGFENCKSTALDGDYCFWCKTGFYGNQKDHLCYSNEEEDDFYKCALSDTTGKYCIGCEDKYYIGYKDHKCSKVDGCYVSEDEDTCSECDDRHCLNVKTGKCGRNDKIVDEDEKVYYRCLKTNKEGTKCAECLDRYELSDKGFCVDKVHCTVEEDGVCVKCKNNRSYSSCLNADFGCVPTSYMKCIECDNVLDFDICTKCPPYYKLKDDDHCYDMDDVFDEEDE